MRENEFFRDNVERLKERFPDKEWLTTKDVCSFLDCSPKTAHRRFPFGKGGRITVATLARSLSKGQVCK